MLLEHVLRTPFTNMLIIINTCINVFKRISKLYVVLILIKYTNMLTITRIIEINKD